MLRTKSRAAETCEASRKGKQVCVVSTPHSVRLAIKYEVVGELARSTVGQPIFHVFRMLFFSILSKKKGIDFAITAQKPFQPRTVHALHHVPICQLMREKTSSSFHLPA